MDERESPVERPEAGLEPRPVNVREYHALGPEKLELLDGYLISGPDYPEERHDLLLLFW